MGGTVIVVPGLFSYGAWGSKSLVIVPKKYIYSNITYTLVTKNIYNMRKISSGGRQLVFLRAYFLSAWGGKFCCKTR
jgi:hypothetical protein